MSEGITTVLFPVSDVGKAKELYSKALGAEPIMDEPYYVGWRIAGQDIGLNPNGHRQGWTGPVCCTNVDDIEARLAELLAAGAEQLEAVRDVGGGKLVATVKDADGNAIGLIQNP